MSKSKRYQNSLEKFDPDGFLSGREALEVLKSFERTKFDESIDLVVRLGVDPRKTEEMIRSTVALPSGTGKAVRIAVFAQVEAAIAAREAGADRVGADALAAEGEGG